LALLLRECRYAPEQKQQQDPEVGASSIEGLAANLWHRNGDAGARRNARIPDAEMMTTNGVEPESLLSSPAQWLYPLFFAGEEVLLNDMTQPPRKASVLGLRLRPELLNKLFRKRNRTPLVHRLILLVHPEYYTLRLRLFHKLSDSICDYLKLFHIVGV
jgi:hypothetical protein